MVSLKSMEQYGEVFQIKVISSLLTHKEFLINIYDILEPEYFSKQSSQWIMGEVLKYYEKYHTTISMDILKVELQKLEDEVLKVAIKEQLKLAYKASEEDLEYVRDEFSSFCKNQQLKKALLSSVDLLQAGDYDSIRMLVDGALKAGQDQNIGHEYDKDVESRYRENNRAVIETPWPQINTILQGGLGNGDYGFIFGNPGGGKSWSLIALGAHAAKRGYNVIHYSLELGEVYVGLRYDACFTKIEVNKIKEHREKVEEVVAEIPGKIIIKEFPAGGATVDTIEAHISKMKDNGFNPDMVIIDYADLLSTKKRTKDRKEEIDDVNLRIKGMARELNIPTWSVSQVNREGSKDKVIEGNKAAGSYDKTMITDFAMSLSRHKNDKLNGTGRFHIMKNRYGMDGMTYSVLVNAATGEFIIKGEYDEDEEEVTTPKTWNNKNNMPSSEVSRHDKKLLSEKFFNITS
jgi:replicative DNA helicase